MALCRSALSDIAGVMNRSLLVAVALSMLAGAAVPITALAAGVDDCVSPGSYCGFQATPPGGASKDATTIHRASASASASGSADAKPPSPTQWTLLADAKLQSVSMQDASSSFGLGLRYATPHWETALVLRKGVVDSLTAAPLDRQFGSFVLAPDTAKVGVTFRVDWYSGTGVYCRPDCDPTRKDVVYIHALRHGVYASLDAGETTVGSNDATVKIAHTMLASSAISFGYSGQIQDEVTLGDSKYPVALRFWVGPTFRIVGGDLTQDERRNLLGGAAWMFFGGEAGAMVRLGTFDLITKLTWIGLDQHDAVAGLERLQLTPSIHFSLPFSVLSGVPDTSGTKKADTAGAGAAPSSAAPASVPAATPSSSAAAPSPAHS